MSAILSSMNTDLAPFVIKHRHRKWNNIRITSPTHEGQNIDFGKVLALNSGSFDLPASR